MIKITCPFCGYSKEVSEDRIPEKAKSIICPVCGKKFSFTIDFFKKAGFGVRFLAIIIDLLLLKIVAILIGAFIDYTLTYMLDKYFYLDKEKINTIIGGVIYFIWSAIPFLYFTISTWKYSGSIGKLFLGIKIVDKNCHKPDLKISFKRECMGKFISGLLFGMGFLFVLFDKNKQALHDKIAKTYVVYNF